MCKKAISLVLLLTSFSSVFLPAQTFWEDANGPYGINITKLIYNPEGVLYGQDYGFPVKSTFRSTDGGFHWDVLSGPSSTPTITDLKIGLDGTLFCRDEQYTKSYFSKDQGHSWTELNLPANTYYVDPTSAADGAILFTNANQILRTFDNLNWDTLFSVAPDTVFWQVNEFYFGKMGWLKDGRIVAEKQSSFIPPNSPNNIAFLISEDNGMSWDTFAEPSISPLGLTLMPNGQFVTLNDQRQICISNLGEAPTCYTPPFALTPQSPNQWIARFLVTNTGRLIVSNLYETLSSDDYGASWQPHPSGFEGSLTHELLPGGYILSQSFWNGNTMRSTDLGQTWTKVGSGTDRALSYSWKFKTNETILAISNGFWRSTDGGFDWELMLTEQTSPLESYYNLDLAPNGDIYLLSSSRLYRTTNDGDSFETINLDTSLGKFYRVAVHPQTGDIYLSGQGLIRSSDQGQTWTVLNETELFSREPIAFHPNGALYCTKNLLIRSNDDGQNWKSVTVSPTPAYNYFDFVRIMPDGKIITVGPSGYAISNDYGNSWQRRNIPIAPLTFALNALGQGFIGDIDNKKIYRTDDDGLNWSVLPLLPSTLATGIFNLAISPDQTLWVCSDGDGHFKTANPTLAVSDPVAKTTGFELYPNPTEAGCRVTLAETLITDALISIFNASGQRIRTWNMPKGSASINLQLDDFPAGIYAITIDNESFKGVQKLLIR